VYRSLAVQAPPAIPTPVSDPLPIDRHLPTIRTALAERRAAVVAAPGAGKTTRVPPAVADPGRVVVLQPRRVAARAVARRIAADQGWTPGCEVGWHVRFERRFSPDTRVRIVTEGVNCPVVRVPGAAHPLRIEHAPGRSLTDALSRVMSETGGQVLCFLPGAGDIERAVQDARAVAARHDAELVPLHGSLDADAQDRALQPAPRRRVVLATNIAETSLTVPGVSVVIDTGLQKVARYDAARAIDTLVLERVTLDSADQRAGRAARLGPGVAIRLWDERDRLRPAREPEVHRVDLAATVLSVLAAGNRLDDFDWFEAPSSDRVAAALSLLRRLGAVADLTVTPLGHRLRRLPLHPRLGRVLFAGGGSFEAAAACALLSERGAPAPHTGATSCDLLPLLDAWARTLPHTRRVAEHLQGLAGDALGQECRGHIDEVDLRRALLSGYPDRVARRRPQDPARVILASGRGARMGRESQVGGGEWLVALDVTDGSPTEALVHMASLVEAEWLEPTARRVEHRLDDQSGTVKAFDVARYDAILISERPVAPDAAERARVLTRAWLGRPPDEATTQLLARARFAGIDLDLEALATAAAATARSVDTLDPAAALSWDDRRLLADGAPDSLAVPSGRTVRLAYAADGRVAAAVKLQELFGLAETPRIGRQQEAVTFELLAPNGRPVQTTRDLRSFWERTYPGLRKQLRGRYPKHPWPEDPWTAKATHRTTLRS